MAAFFKSRLGRSILPIAAGAVGWFAVAVDGVSADPRDSIDRLETEIRHRLSALRDLDPCQVIWLSSVAGTVDYLNKEKDRLGAIMNTPTSAEFDGRSLRDLLGQSRDATQENAARAQATIENLGRVESGYGAAIEKLDTYSRPPHSDRLRRSATDDLFETNELIREIEDSWLGDAPGYAPRGSCYELPQRRG